MQVKGTIDTVFPTEQVSDKFKKRAFWITIDEDTKYPQKIQLEFTQDKCVELDKIKAGQKVDVEFNLRGREYNGKVFVNLQAWKIAVVGGEVKSAKGKSEVTADDQINNPELEELPF